MTPDVRLEVQETFNGWIYVLVSTYDDEPIFRSEDVFHDPDEAGAAFRGALQALLRNRGLIGRRLSRKK